MTCHFSVTIQPGRRDQWGHGDLNPWSLTIILFIYQVPLPIAQLIYSIYNIRFRILTILKWCISSTFRSSGPVTLGSRPLPTRFQFHYYYYVPLLFFFTLMYKAVRVGRLSSMLFSTSMGFSCSTSETNSGLGPKLENPSTPVPNNPSSHGLVAIYPLGS